MVCLPIYHLAPATEMEAQRLSSLPPKPTLFARIEVRLGPRRRPFSRPHVAIVTAFAFAIAVAVVVGFRNDFFFPFGDADTVGFIPHRHASVLAIVTRGGRCDEKVRRP